MGSVNKSGGKFTEKTLLASLFFVDNQRHNNKVGFGMCAVADAVAFAFRAECHVAGKQLHFRAVVFVFVCTALNIQRFAGAFVLVVAKRATRF